MTHFLGRVGGVKASKTRFLSTCGCMPLNCVVGEGWAGSWCGGHGRGEGLTYQRSAQSWWSSWGIGRGVSPRTGSELPGSLL